MDCAAEATEAVEAAEAVAFAQSLECGSLPAEQEQEQEEKEQEQEQEEGNLKEGEDGDEDEEDDEDEDDDAAGRVVHWSIEQVFCRHSRSSDLLPALSTFD